MQKSSRITIIQIFDQLEMKELVTSNKYAKKSVAVKYTAIQVTNHYYRQRKYIKA
jgi:hypothetical protein